MALRQSRSPNSVLRWKPNQFPSARIGYALPTRDINDSDDNGGDSTGPELSEQEKAKREYLRDRFKPGEHSGVDDSESPCGRAARGGQ